MHSIFLSCHNNLEIYETLYYHRNKLNIVKQQFHGLFEQRFEFSQDIWNHLNWKVTPRHFDIASMNRSIFRPSPRPNTSNLERLATMSPAARRLATSRLKLVGNLPSKSFCSPSPGVRWNTPRTPSGIQTPKLNLGIRKAGTSDNLTDDLLNINLPKRKQAADFF